MFKLPGRPSPRADVTELSDFLELQCWVQGHVSRQEIVRFLGILDDNLDEDGEIFTGCNDIEEEYGNVLDEALNEIEHRESTCDGGYPFHLNDTGTVLRLCRSPGDSETRQRVYLYLLAATRLNMSQDRRHADIDGALLMEHVSARALGSYLGPRSRFVVFGTSMGGNFQDRVNRLCRSLREPTAFANIDGEEVPVWAKDGQLDIVAWLPFSDLSPGQLIVFAQAKTGTNWREKACELKPEIFQRKWLRDGGFLVSPIRAFCLSDSIPQKRWKSTCIDLGLLFDRCRLVQCCRSLDEETNGQVVRWLEAARAVVARQLGE